MDTYALCKRWLITLSQRHVAGSIGRLCLAIFGVADRAAATPLADDLGVAMQLTNILRDVREDSERGRTYLPAEDLRRFGVEVPATARPDSIAELIRFEARRNSEWYHARARAGGAARLPQRLLSAGDDGHLQGYPRADRARARRGAPAPDLATRLGEGVAGRA